MICSTEAVMAVDPGNVSFVRTDRDLFLMEMMDKDTTDIWMCLDPVSKEQFKSLQDLPERFNKTGFAHPSYDTCLFRSAGVTDDPLEVETHGGFRWVSNARSLSMEAPQQPGGPAKIMVGKDHVLGYDAGRSLSVMSLNGEDYVEVVGTDAEDAERILPEGATLRKVMIDEPLVVELPKPTTTWFWLNTATKIRSFQGPVTLPGNL